RSLCSGLDGDDKSETWLLAHVWTMVDHVFDNLPLSVVRIVESPQVWRRVQERIKEESRRERGLPYIHILLILHDQDRPHIPTDYDRFVSAEIPNSVTHPQLYQTVISCMIHGPCGDAGRNAPCMKDGRYSQHYPKPFNAETRISREEKLERKKMGRRLDLILRKKKLELGAGEAGRRTNDNDSKLIRERDLKLPKALKDMIMCFKTEAGVDDVQGLEVVGLLQYGLKMSSIIMDIPVNYVHRVTRTKNVVVPSDWNNLPDFRKVLFMALSIKEIVSRTVELLQSKLGNDNDGLSKVMEPPEVDSYQLPQIFDSQE
ncbi:hypothetical protein INT45_004940, partial [Circinella minor]